MQVDDAMLNEAQYSEFIAFCSAYEQKFEKLAYAGAKKPINDKKSEVIELGDAKAIGVL